jgi:hypothetical protein
MSITTATATAIHTFTASTEDRRRCTCGKSRNTAAHGYDAKARKVAATNVAEVAAAYGVPAAALAAEGDRIMRERAAALDAMPTDDEPADLLAMCEADAAMKADMDVTCPQEESPADAHEARATELAEAVTAGQVSFDAAAAELLGGAPVNLRAVTDAAWMTALTTPPAVETPAKRKAKVETERMTSLWVARNMVDGLIARGMDSNPAVASIAAKVDASTPNNRGGRTIRLTKAELQALSTIATEVENTATEAGDGTVAMSARKLHARLDGYLATY